MTISQHIEHLRTLLDLIKTDKTVSKTGIDDMISHLTALETSSVNENFTGTIEEIRSFADILKDTDSTEDFIMHHKLNLSRWTEELQILEEGSGGVTLDYEQRKGREV